jgi:hypothetical protein
MTDQEPNGYELQRSIADLRQSVDNGLTEIKLSLAGLVSRDLFEAELRRQSDKFEAVNQRVDDIEARRKWWLAGVLVPLAICLVSVVSLILAR